MDTEENAMDGLQGPTSLPSKRALLSILDKLQKKDTFGAFAEMADTEKHITIKHPMDFETIRRKLDGGEYSNLEQFEADVLLVSSNVMCYNEPDTVHYCQAQAIEELAKRKFKNLRQYGDVIEFESEDESMPKPHRGRPPKKKIIKLEADAQAFTEAPPAIAGNGRRLASLRPNHGWKGNNHKSSNTNAPRASYRHGAQRNDGLVRPKTWPHVKGGSRRSTYYQEQPSLPTSQLPLPTWNSRTSNHLVALHHQQHSYANSLAHFAKDLGPIGWDMAARQIKQALPLGTNFGRGWVEDVGSSASIVLPTLNVASSIIPRHSLEPQPPVAMSDFASASAMLQQFNSPTSSSASLIGPSHQASVDRINGFNNIQLQKFLGSSMPNSLSFGSVVLPTIHGDAPFGLVDAHHGPFRANQSSHRMSSVHLQVQIMDASSGQQQIHQHDPKSGGDSTSSHPVVINRFSS